jgi:surface carbohydrate biosynthesis protein
MSHQTPLIIPVENQVRELDPKLLLACIAARSGFTSIIGSHRDIDFQITSFPRGLYLNKSMTERNLRMFQIMRRFGHEILTWDEEALVHLPPDIYYSRRLSPVAIQFIAHLFAWGEDNAELWRRYSHLPSKLPIHITGNPRNDMLRPELHGFYADEVRSIREKFGDVLLINTNFNHINAFFPAQNLFKPMKQPGQPPQFGKAGVGMTLSYAEGLRDHKQCVFQAFQQLIPALAVQFPKVSIVVRPHPTEGQDVYHRIAAGHSRIHVTNEGNVVPWLLAARALIHNGCTTGVEAYVMKTPAIAYRPVVNEAYDSGFYILPNRLSHQAFNLDHLVGLLDAVLNAKLGPAEGPELDAFVTKYLAALKGPLACERMLEVIETIVSRRPEIPKPPLTDRLIGRTLAGSRRALKRLKAHLPGSHAPPQFHRHRYPGISLDQLKTKIRRFQITLKNDAPVGAEQLSDTIFRIYPG